MEIILLKLPLVKVQLKSEHPESGRQDLKCIVLILFSNKQNSTGHQSASGFAWCSASCQIDAVME